MDREQMITRILEDVEVWDRKVLVGYVQKKLEEVMLNITDEDLASMIDTLAIELNTNTDGHDI